MNVYTAFTNSKEVHRNKETVLPHLSELPIWVPTSSQNDSGGYTLYVDKAYNTCDNIPYSIVVTNSSVFEYALK